MRCSVSCVSSLSQVSGLFGALKGMGTEKPVPDHIMTFPNLKCVGKHSLQHADAEWCGEYFLQFHIYFASKYINHLNVRICNGTDQSIIADTIRPFVTTTDMLFVPNQ